MDLQTLRRALEGDALGTVGSDERCLALAAEAEGLARYLAQNLDKRANILSSGNTRRETLFDGLSEYWTILANAFDPSPLSSSATTMNLSSEDSRISLALALAKLERNMIAGIQEYQELAAPHENSVRKLIFNITTFVRIEDPRFFILHSVIIQLLSNILSPTSNRPDADKLASRFLPVYLCGGRDQDVIIRVLDVRDTKTNIATLHLINNLVKGSPERIQLLLEEPGVKWCAKILGRMDEWVELHDGRFELGCSIFNYMIDLSLHPTLFSHLSSPSEPLTPSQTTLLKILDSHLASKTSNDPSPPPNMFLIPLFHTLSVYALSSMKSEKDDPRLPKIFEGLVLLSEALSCIGLKVQERKDKGASRMERGGEEEMVSQMKSDDDEVGIVRLLVFLLRALLDFFPRVKPALGSISSPKGTDEPTPFTNLKRDMVKLLGVLTFGDTAVGDQVREAGGVQLILGMTELDERNPYLREHALFCVRNLMLNNPANQAIIGQMDPIGVVSETGEVLPVPEKMKSK